MKPNPSATRSRLGDGSGLAARRRQRAGFTLIEVIVALGVMVIGAMAMLGFQRQVVRANRFARDQTVAAQIAENWLELLKVDARRWTQSTGRAAAGWPNEAALLANTQWLSAIVGSHDDWQALVVPAAVPAFRAFDAEGVGMAPSNDPDNPHYFCVYVRYGWVFYGKAMRADVRVVWLRNVAAPPSNWTTCGEDDISLYDAGGSDPPISHQVILSTVLKPS